MTESPEELAAVEQLLAESEALRAWLAKLNDAQAGIPGSVRDRVRADYQRRLDQLTAGLSAHADVVAGKLSDDRAEHAGLLSRATEAREALAEAELRHAVGEYDADRFEDSKRRYTSDIETFDVALAAVAERIARLEEVHSLVQRTPVEPITDFDVTIDAPDSVPDVPSIIIDELAPDARAALSVFEDGEPNTGPANAVPPAPGTPEVGPLSFRPTGSPDEWPRPASQPARPFASAPPLGIPAADIPPRFVRPGERLTRPPAPPVVAPGSAASSPEPVVETVRNEPVVAGAAPESIAAPVGRTLRCGECGAMNRPLEWYCEKCGAELTAV